MNHDEAATLAAAMSNQSSCAVVTQRLSAEHFSGPTLRQVFTAIAACQTAGKHGATEVLDELARSGETDAVKQLHSVVSKGPTVASPTVVENLVDKVERAAHRRRMRHAGESVAAAADDLTVPEEELTGIAVNALVNAHLGYESQAGIVRPEETFDRLDALYEGKREHEPVSTGWRVLDPFYKPAKGRWTLVTGVPGHGKSALLDAMMVSIVKSHGWRFAICSPENQPLVEHEAGIMSVWAGAPFHDGPTRRMSRDTYEKGKGWLAEHFTFILPDEQGRTIDSILALARIEHHVSPLDGLIVDPWNELEHSRPSNMREDEYISQSLTRLRSFARQHDMHVWMVAHPTKLRKQDDGLYPVPTPYDVSGAAHWRNKADNALAVWRDHSKPKDGTQVHVQKVRFQRQGEGTEGMVRLMFDKPSGRFYEMGGAV